MDKHMKTLHMKILPALAVLAAFLPACTSASSFYNQSETRLSEGDSAMISEKNSDELSVATFAAGCFWGVEHKFGQLPGVISSQVGYTGGDKENPTYLQVCRGSTGHAEAVKVLYDPDLIRYTDLLTAFFSFHDPTQINRQGPDIGDQYRSAIFFHTPEQKAAVEQKIRELNESGLFDKPIATLVASAAEFYTAEEYHQRYYEKMLKKK
jgi:peptide-methionine (S)-S-oxide reductase